MSLKCSMPYSFSVFLSIKRLNLDKKALDLFSKSSFLVEVLSVFKARYFTKFLGCNLLSLSFF